MSSLKASVLQTFKKLHRTRLKVFAGDVKALSAARAKINEEYKKNINVKDIESIIAMNKFAEDVIKELRTQVIQAKEVKKGVYVARITEDTVKLDNLPFNEEMIPEEGVRRGKSKCCQDISQNK
ncbi:complex III assembly factor LYRM7 [Aricia agestis]|uniref:complex III assembly factor LYRM7 n=1 Tax=Aricia agestis TaxID=91739 RepID=UPI001C202206|nr:complex III assembly factor LYRM7 [Aricia agestis]